MYNRMTRRSLIYGLGISTLVQRTALGGRKKYVLGGASANGLVASPSLKRLSSTASTPENDGFIVDRTGTEDATSVLNSWIRRLVANGDKGEMGHGMFRTSGPLIATGGASLRLSGNGPLATQIRTAGSDYPAVHIKLTTGIEPSGWIEGIGVAGPNPNPTTGNAGFLVDATTLFELRNLDVHNCDIAYDWVNNCFNGSGYNLSASRFFSCNVGIYLRRGFQSGSDMNFYNSNITALLHSYCIEGGGGGFAFFGGQCGTGNSTSVDTNGVIQLGWDYINQVEHDGLVSVLFSRVGLEGWHGCHGIRAYGENNVKFDSCSFNASAATAGQIALDIFKGTNLKNSVISFESCNVTGHYKNHKLASAEGQFAMPLRQTNWYVAPNGYTANGVRGGNPLADITTSP
jgi:hypothetical protein